ncbi:MAG: DUF1963 domain-containing protein [Oscillospiraceae bacterium]|nr:DUF1963 domain-containing protein [Oscillospiraceae bacterium]MBQ8780656.1 DUF1963 domain-containing protein [Oscillospiraceae bacterium]
MFKLIRFIVTIMYRYLGIGSIFFLVAFYFYDGAFTSLSLGYPEFFATDLITAVLFTAAGVFFTIRRHKKIIDGTLDDPFDFSYIKFQKQQEKALDEADKPKSVEELFERFLKRKFYSKYYFRLTPSENVPDIYSTKLGGVPYIPKGTEYPCGSDGKPLRLLAQLNFDEFPHLQYYPNGILQFFCKDDFKLGMNTKNPTEQENFRIVYYDTITDRENLLSESEMPTIEKQPFAAFPIIKETALVPSEVKTDTLKLGDYRFEKLLLEFAKLYKFCPKKTKSMIDLPESLKEPVYKAFSNSCTAVGGYPSFKKDPRETNSELSSCDEVLLRLDSADLNGYIDGFSSCCFLISMEDLRNRDFSKVAYYWEK